MRTLIPVALLLLSCKYDAYLDPDAPLPLNVVTGTVVVAGLSEGADTIVLVFHADDPPPPTGTGSPFTFSAIPASAYTESEEADGLISAPFYVSSLPDGDYLVTALVDVDGDFHPLLDAMAGATCGDVLGAYVEDPITGAYATIHAAGGRRISDVTIFAGRPMTFERPAFEIDGTVVLDRQAAVDNPDVPQTFRVRPTGIASEIVTLAGPYEGGADTCASTFLVNVVDADGDGLPDPHPDLPAPVPLIYDIWPRFYMVYLGVPNAEGGIDATLAPGEQWAGPAFIYPDFVLYGFVDENTPTPSAFLPGGNKLDLIFSGAAIHTHETAEADCAGLWADGVCEEVVTTPLDLPAGAWGVTTIQITGQTWTMPNETAAFPATDESFDPSSQASVVIVQ